MSFLNISAALDGHLSTMPSLPPVAWENIEFKPEAGTLYLRPTNLQGDTVQSSLGESGQDVTIGIYQVDVFAAAGKGKNEATAMADNIANHFKRGSRLTYNGVVVTVTSARRTTAKSSNGWYQIPVEIVYKSYTEARV